jgi:CRP-like cAMP-binding protein
MRMNAYLPFPLLSAWSPSQQKKFISGLERMLFSDGQIIFEKDDTSKDVYFILTGAVKSLNYSDEGRISYFRIRQAGDCFGYYSAISEEQRTATVHAVGATELARMAGTAFFSLVLENPDIGRPFLKLIVGLLRIETNRLTNLTTLTMHRRVAAELSDQSTAQDSLILTLPDRVEFASYLGMTRETLARALAGLVKKKLIKLTGKKIFILNLQRLTALINDPNSH